MYFQNNILIIFDIYYKNKNQLFLKKIKHQLFQLFQLKYKTQYIIVRIGQKDHKWKKTEKQTFKKIDKI